MYLRACHFTGDWTPAEAAVGSDREVPKVQALQVRITLVPEAEGWTEVAASIAGGEARHPECWSCRSRGAGGLVFLGPKCGGGILQLCHGTASSSVP